MANQKKESLKSKEIITRPPVVTIMGHVDHGKTSLLDYIRKTKVAEGEAGGITQSIGAYQAIFKNKRITFIDTPGHEAFSSMRKRGGQAADIIVLVVSAGDGVMPQSEEVISIAKFTDTPMIVAINKSDLPSANPQKVKQQLAERGVLVEGWGGDVICVEVSAKTGQGVDALLESILALSEMQKLGGDPLSDVEGFIIESKLDVKRGPVFTCIVRNGSLRVGSEISASGTSGKVKALFNFLRQSVKEACPGDPVEVLGFPKVPRVGEIFVESKNMELLSEVEKDVSTGLAGSEEGKVVNIILKADTVGSLEALEASIGGIKVEEIKPRVLHKATGDISESDISLASTSNALVLGFNIRLSQKIVDLADSLKVKVHTYKIIYELLEEVDKVLLDASYKEEVKAKGRAEVLKLFPLPSGDVVCGCKVVSGAIKPDSKVAVFRDGTPDSLYKGKVKNLKRGKDEVKVVGKGVECGILLKPVFPDIRVGDIIEVL